MAQSFFRDFVRSSGAPITVEYEFRSSEGASIICAWTNTPGFDAIDLNLPDEEREIFEGKLSETHIQESDDFA